MDFSLIIRSGKFQDREFWEHGACIHSETSYIRVLKCIPASLGSVPRLGNSFSSSPSYSPLFPHYISSRTGSFLFILNIYSWCPHHPWKYLFTSLTSCHASTYSPAVEKTGPPRSPRRETYVPFIQAFAIESHLSNRSIASCQAHAHR